MDLKYEAYRYKVKARGCNEKAEIIRNVARKMGQDGLVEFAQLLGEDPDKLAEYANLKQYFKDRSRIRRQRKPKMRNSAEAYIDPDINKQKLIWGCAEII